MEKPLDNGTTRSVANERHRGNVQEILGKSSRLMARVGFHGTSMRELARETGRSLAGLYHYFQSKEDLLFLINHNGFTRLNDAWRRLSQHLETPEERLYGFIFLHTHYFVANIDEMRVMNWGTQALTYDRAMSIRNLKDQHTDDARTVVKEIHVAATGRPVEAQRGERLTYLLFGMMNWIFGWYSSDEHGEVDDLVCDIYSVFLRGIGGGVDEKRTTALASTVALAFEQGGSASLWDTELAEH